MLRTSLFGIVIGALGVAGCSATNDTEGRGSGAGFLEANWPGVSAAGGAANAAAGEPEGILADASVNEYVNRCSEREADDSLGVYVLASMGNDTATCGSRATPCKTIAHAMARANGLMSKVYIGNGTYRESVSLVKGLHLEGGWSVEDTTWITDCSPGATTISNTGDTIITADDLNGEAGLGFITVDNGTRATPGQSLFGIRASGESTRLLLEEVQVLVAKAGDGEDGVSGAYGVHGSLVSFTGCTPGTGEPGKATAKLGDNATPGYFDGTGYHPGDGSAGQSGTPGSNGKGPTVAPTCLKCSKCGSNTSCKSAPDSCGTAGTAGCGGGAGQGGGGGKGGGSSIAVFVWDATVYIRGGLFAARSGWRGGVGGFGGRGGEGSEGMPGEQAAEVCNQCTIQATSVGCGGAVTSCVLTPIGRGAAGRAGGPGGVGSDGGPGGDGSGGFSFAIYRNHPERLTVLGAVELYGEPGGVSLEPDPGAAGPIGGP